MCVYMCSIHLQYNMYTVLLRMMSDIVLNVGPSQVHFALASQFYPHHGKVSWKPKPIT